MADELHEQRKTELFVEVRDVVCKLLLEEICPTIDRVISRLSPTILREWKTVAGKK